MTQDTPQSTQHAEGSQIAQAAPGSVATVITNIFRGTTAEQRALRNRQAMLQLVRNTWIKGVLEQSLHGAAMIELGLEERADAVERPWDVVLQMPDQPNRTLPSGIRIVDVFDEMNRALLILGEPGSGKTTMLLELARDTIARAEQDPMQPIPVVFNLSSWIEKRKPLAEWLVEELNTKYNIPEKIAHPWVENDDLLLLLDGLDEVKVDHREVCVKAINDFRQQHMTPLVACSRIADYKALTTKLKLQGAVLLQPLAPQQIDQYLAGAESELAAVREALRNDATLQKLAQSPLMLNVMILAYRGTSSVDDLQTLDTTEACRRYIFDTYVQRMFKRVARTKEELYPKERTTHWLAWLAQDMIQRSKTVLLIERMDPSWLQTPTQQLQYIGTARLVLGLTSGLLPGFISGILLGSVGGLLLGVIVGALLGVISWLCIVRLNRLDSLTMLGSKDVFWELADLAGMPLISQEWSWRILVSSLLWGLVGGLTLGLLGGLLGGSFYGLASGSNELLGGLLHGGLVGIFVFGVWGELFGVMMFFIYGGHTTILRFAVHVVLWICDYIPWNYARFLDYATDRIFLRKVGGGYIFVHRMLQEYFASLAETKEVTQ